MKKCLLVILVFEINTLNLASCQEITGITFFHYSQPSGDDANSSFGFKRVYLTVTKKVSENITYKFQADVDYKSSPQNMYIKNAKVDWKTSQVKVVIGMQGMNMFKVQENTWGKRYIQKMSMDQYKYSSSADIGIGLYKSMNKIGFSALITNGNGYKTSENDDHKKLSFQAVYGEQKLNKNDGFNVGTSFSTEPYNFDSLMVKNKTVIGVFGGYAGKNIRGGLEWNQKEDTGATVTSQVISTYGHYQLKSNLGMFIRYDMFSPNTKENSEDKNYLITGLEFSPGKGLTIAPNYRKIGDDTELIVNFEFKF